MKIFEDRLSPPPGYPDREKTLALMGVLNTRRPEVMAALRRLIETALSLKEEDFEDDTLSREMGVVNGTIARFLASEGLGAGPWEGRYAAQSIQALVRGELGGPIYWDFAYLRSKD